MSIRSLCLPVVLASALLTSAAHAQQPSGTELAQMQVRFSQMDEKMRKIEGRLEELDFENRRLRETLDRFQQDTNLRLTDIESKPSTAAPTSAPASEEETPAVSTSQPPQNLKVPDSAGGPKFNTPREQYDYAFRLLNQTQYAESGAAFESFIKANPKDPLIGNAFYWAGETYYVRQNYVQAADYFRQGYEALPAGPKAGDNLLKLGMALNNLKKNTEACVVLKQVIAKFGATSGSIKNKAEQERTRAGCK